MPQLPETVGVIDSLFRYPVKSMLGESLTDTEVTPGGLLGDRAFALIDTETGKIASAKYPRKWAHLFQFKAAYASAPTLGEALPPVQITLPDNTTLLATQEDVDEVLSNTLGRSVRLVARNKFTFETTATAEGWWPDLSSPNFGDAVSDYQLAEGHFFDGAVLHIVTSASLQHLQRLYPEGNFSAARFRPNLVVATPAGQRGFVENNWVGRTLCLGTNVQLHIERPCPRCVMTTLPQGALPKDMGILKTAAQFNAANVGVYASVIQGGVIRRGDGVHLL